MKSVNKVHLVQISNIVKDYEADQAWYSSIIFFSLIFIFVFQILWVGVLAPNPEHLFWEGQILKVLILGLFYLT